MKNDKWHMVFFVTIKFRVGDEMQYFPEKMELGHKGGVIMVDVFAITQVAYVTFDVGLALYCQTTLLFLAS